MDRLVDLAKRHGISTETLKRWEKQGLFEFGRSPLGRRIVTPEAVRRIDEIIRDRIAQYLPKGNNKS